MGRCGRCWLSKRTGLVGGGAAHLVVDDTALPKKGTLSVGVARQYCGQLGKRANCQSLVSLCLAQGEVPVPVGLRLFLPEEWTGDAGRCARAGVPEAAMTPASKGEIALSELDRVRATGLRFGCVLADAGYGASAAFRHGLDARGLSWAFGVPKNQEVYGIDVRLVPPQGRARKPVPSEEPRAAEDFPGRPAMAAHNAAAWHQGQARRPVRGHSRPGRGWSGVGQQSSPAGPRSMAGRRVAYIG